MSKKREPTSNVRYRLALCYLEMHFDVAGMGDVS